MVADGKKIDNVGKCHKVKLQMQEYNLELDFFAVPLGGIDVVLGIQWLQTLGTYSANHQELLLNSMHSGKHTNYMGSNHLQHNWLHHIRWKRYVGKMHQRTYLNVEKWRF